MSDILAPQFSCPHIARTYLEQVRWPDGPICPHCGVLNGHRELNGATHRDGLYQCNDCRSQFTITVGTVFERSHIPLNKWLAVVHLMCASKKAISAHQIHRMFGLTYKTAWFMCHRVREAMRSGDTSLLGVGGGIVEVDETFWGTSKPKGKTARGYEHKMKIVSLVERGGKKRSVHVPAVTGATLRGVLKAHLSPDAHLMTDEASAYTKVGREYASHGVVRHKDGEYARGNVTTNHVEASFSLLKRGLIGTYHHVGEQHLQRYVTEFHYRWNLRKVADKERSDALLMQVSGKRLVYAKGAAR